MKILEILSNEIQKYLLPEVKKPEIQNKNVTKQAYEVNGMKKEGIN